METQVLEVFLGHLAPLAKEEREECRALLVVWDPKVNVDPLVAEVSLEPMDPRDQKVNFFYSFCHVAIVCCGLDKYGREKGN